MEDPEGVTFGSWKEKGCVMGREKKAENISGDSDIYNTV